jgi:hypothetical protein
MAAREQDQKPLTPGTAIAAGATAAAFGLYFIMVAGGVLPPPGRANGPPWLVFGCGLAFLGGGLAIAIPVMVTGQTSANGELPTGAPHWLRIVQYVLGLTVFASLAAIGTWIAFGAGARSFNVDALFFETSGGGEMVGRIIFGIGAAITWLGLIGVAVSGWRKLIRRS